jgi:hypothetical protein
VYKLRDILSTWYGSKATAFLDAVRMRLIPPLDVLSDANRQENYGSALAKQASFCFENGKGIIRDTRLDPTECFGDNIPLKPKGTLRIGFQNIGGFTQQTRTVKEDFIRIGITSWEFDIFGTAETNLDWRLQTEDNKLWSRTKEWWEHLHISYAHNITFPPIEDKQYGGTA